MPPSKTHRGVRSAKSKSLRRLKRNVRRQSVRTSVLGLMGFRIIVEKVLARIKLRFDALARKYSTLPNPTVLTSQSTMERVQVAQEQDQIIEYIRRRFKSSGMGRSDILEAPGRWV